MDYERELLKGNTQTIVLAILQDAPQHGYSIAREVERRSGNALSFKDGTLYPALHALEHEGMVAGCWEAPHNGPARKVYTITEAGLKELARRRPIWNAFARTIYNMIGGKLDAQPI